MGTDLTVLEKYPVLLPDSEAAQLVTANVAGEEISVADLDRIRVPGGGMTTTWTVPDIEGERTEKSIEGIIIHVARRRAYWSNPNPSGDPPDCRSDDCIRGVGNPGGECADCPLNEFGTAARPDGSQGRGKACRESTLLFLLTPGRSLPIVVCVPPGSLRIVKQYRLRLQVPYFQAITRLELVKEKSKDGVSYAQIKPSYVGKLDADMTKSVRKYAEALKGVMERAQIDPSDVESD
ncbi:MAG: hypothetical protein KGL39_42005 [Patescibacteria group bacterium]|nr:hypothetical protein [Patescibacteria group bacterium]